MTGRFQKLDQAYEMLARSAPESAFRLSLEAFEAQEAGSEVLLGWCYATGAGTTKDELKARDFYEIGCSNGNPEAFFYMAHLESIHADEFQRNSLLRQAAFLGHIEAGLELAKSSSLSLTQRIEALNTGVRAGNVFCIAASGKLLIRTRKLKNVMLGVCRITCAFAITVFRGLRHSTVESLESDPAFKRR